MKLGIQETYLNIIKVVYNRSIPNINLKEEKYKAIPQKSGIRSGCPLSIGFDILIRAKYKFRR